MTKKSNKIVFFGSGPVAEESLKLLCKDFEFEAVITKPSTLDSIKSAVPNTTVHSVSTKNELDLLVETHDFESQIAILIDFGIIVSPKVINKFPLGIVNSHFSLLPQWRGADPITFAILSGQTKTGVSMMLISEGMDEGKILGYTEETISKTDDSITLTNKLIEASTNQLITCIPLYINGDIQPLDQIQAGQNMGITEVSYSRKLTKLDGKIDWNKPAEHLEREIRAFIVWPKSYTELAGHSLIIKEAEVLNRNGKPGDYYVESKQLIVYCGEDALSINKLQPSGKKEMSVEAFLAGYKL